MHLGMSVPYWPTRRGFDYFWGFVCSEPTWLADWFPKLTGKQTADGQDLRAILGGRPASGTRDLCWRFADALVQTPLSHAVRRGDWKLLKVGSARSLFDLSRDPAEELNLSGRNPEVVADLERRLAVWIRSLN